MSGGHFLPRAIAVVSRRLAERQQRRRYNWLDRSEVIERNRAKSTQQEESIWAHHKKTSPLVGGFFMVDSQ